MAKRVWLWIAFLVWLPGCAWAAYAPVRIVRLQAAPDLSSVRVQPTPLQSAKGGPRWYLHAGNGHTTWFALTLTKDWHAASPPLLVIADATRARIGVYAPPDYRLQTRTVFDAGDDPTLSHHAVVYQLPASLRAGQPIYLVTGIRGQAQPVQVGVTDTRSYRVADLRHIRVSTFFTTVQVAMALVIVCFWIVLRDRMFVYFIVYAGAQALYGMAVSGELFALDPTGYLGAGGFHVGECMAALAAGFSVWFILDFADLRRYVPRLAFLLGLLRWPFLVCAVLIWLPFLDPDTWLPNAVNYLLVVAVLLAFTASWLAWRRGNRQAGFFLLSWVPLLALTVLRVAQLILALPLPVWLEYGFPGSMAWAAVIITVGLADRTLQVRRERDLAVRDAEFDPLTGVFNRGAIMRRLERACIAAGERGVPLAVVFLDIDHFKRINDTLGHTAGDACLCAVTDCVRARLGERDRMGRYGGEEFLVVLVGDSARSAGEVAEDLVQRVAAQEVSIGARHVRLTISAGVAAWAADAGGSAELIARADAAQYRAKAAGRNRVVVWEPDVPAEAAAEAVS